jgi:WhiB family redox-sensing transcriptional regulator
MRQRRDSAGFRVVDQEPKNPLLALMGIEVPDWVGRSLCSQTDPESFFPEKGGSTREAKKVCMGCEVRAECLVYALDNDERHGIWGGMSERERRALGKRRCGDCKATVEKGRHLCDACRDRHVKEKNIRYQDRKGRAIA